MVRMNLQQLEVKLAKLRHKLALMENEDLSTITRRRVASDMGDDYRENEGAKMVMEQHDIWYIRKVALKKEMAKIKLHIVRLKTVEAK